MSRFSCESPAITVYSIDLSRRSDENLNPVPPLSFLSSQMHPQGQILDGYMTEKLMRGVRAMTNSQRQTLRASAAQTRRDDPPGEKPTTVGLQ